MIDSHSSINSGCLSFMQSKAELWFGQIFKED
jgi:hypothetical protein